MIEACNAILEELKRLKRRGVTSVYVSDTAFERLRSLRTATAVRGEEPAEARERLPDLPAAGFPSAVGSGGKAGPAAETARVFSLAPIPERPPEVMLPEGDKRTQWEALRRQVLECSVSVAHVREGCKLVFGMGNLDADIFFVGEAPGADEEKAGEPFVGPAGELLSKMIQAMGLRRDEVYIGNIMTWRPEMPTPTGNRAPTQQEMAFCLPYLRGQIDIVKPKVLVALGMTAVAGLLGPDPKRRLGKIRGTWGEFNGIPTMVTYHPSYVLRYGSTRVKRVVWEDLLQVMERVGYPISDKQKGYFR